MKTDQFRRGARVFPTVLKVNPQNSRIIYEAFLLNMPNTNSFFSISNKDWFIKSLSSKYISTSRCRSRSRSVYLSIYLSIYLYIYIYIYIYYKYIYIYITHVYFVTCEYFRLILQPLQNVTSKEVHSDSNSPKMLQDQRKYLQVTK